MYGPPPGIVKETWPSFPACGRGGRLRSERFGSGLECLRPLFVIPIHKSCLEFPRRSDTLNVDDSLPETFWFRATPAGATNQLGGFDSPSWNVGTVGGLAPGVPMRIHGSGAVRVVLRENILKHGLARSWGWQAGSKE